ncbi:ORF6C domain-containing protein [Halomonas sp. McH1-25]|uniref:phage antirepressor N-terminal domain-containing protein n=1 Tax=unclassified Halomonas TaxID=2609666 RepID=UPI001EF4D36B|nr:MULTISPECIES: phage antirepressor N-terminal domain-containing protein [unclassified Halomonas]MCG7598893.1 ORF6C domain-containing protein [Halomonas sp. McH1-25]MCP1340856.1 ORF6C domain-containing protein [Halomonas sp. FL8]MCP1361261.1 ORF6C domain-containing protein [Halomonas sp. BBD45]MCP1363759.1 ORF6C domain-containing protein [Halomonas sp. BBD48]
MNSTTNAQCSNVQQPTVVPFHGANLLLVEHDGQPYTPMKPIVDGMGLDWRGQQAKIKANQRRWATVEISSIVAADGKKRSMICMPLRKLPGWLMTIMPNKVKSLVVREKVEQYQDECDDVLWRYWNDGVAVNPRITLTPEHQHGLHQAVKQKAMQAAEPMRRKAFSQLWNHVKDHFQVARYQDIDDSRYTEALGAVMSFELEGDWLPAEGKRSAEFSDDDLSDLYILLCHVHWIHRHWSEFRIEEALRMMQSPAPAYIHEHMSMANTFKNRLAKAKGELLEASRQRLGLNYGLFPIH